MKKAAEKAGFGSEGSRVRAFRSVLGATPETVRAGFKPWSNRRGWISCVVATYTAARMSELGHQC